MSEWQPVCRLDQLVPERGVAALVEHDQVAVFLLEDGTVHAVAHRDPFSGSNVMARGIVGSSQGRDTVASPMYKQVFDLATGECLTEPGSLPVWRARVRDGVVEVGARSAGRPTEHRVDERVDP